MSNSAPDGQVGKCSGCRGPSWERHGIELEVVEEGWRRGGASLSYEEFGCLDVDSWLIEELQRDAYHCKLNDKKVGLEVEKSVT